MQKPVVAFIAGKTSPQGKRMSHSGAINGGTNDTAQAKMDSLRKNGITVAESPAHLGAQMAKALGVKTPVPV